MIIQFQGRGGGVSAASQLTSSQQHSRGSTSVGVCVRVREREGVGVNNGLLLRGSAFFLFFPFVLRPPCHFHQLKIN